MLRNLRFEANLTLGKNISVFFCSESNVISKTTFACDTDPCMHNPQRRKGWGEPQVDRKMIIASQAPKKVLQHISDLVKVVASFKSCRISGFRAPNPTPFLSLPISPQFSLPWFGSPIWDFFLKIVFTPSLKFRTIFFYICCCF